MKETTFIALYVRQHIMQKTENINCPFFVDSHYPHLLIHVPSTSWIHLSCSSSEPPSGQLKHNKTHGCPSVRPCLFFSLCPIHHFISLCFQGVAHLFQNLCMSRLHCNVFSRVCGFTECIIMRQEEHLNQNKSTVSVQFFKSIQW